MEHSVLWFFAPHAERKKITNAVFVTMCFFFFQKITSDKVKYQVDGNEVKESTIVRISINGWAFQPTRIYNANVNTESRGIRVETRSETDRFP